MCKTGEISGGLSSLPFPSPSLSLSVSVTAAMCWSAGVCSALSATQEAHLNAHGEYDMCSLWSLFIVFFFFFFSLSLSLEANEKTLRARSILRPLFLFSMFSIDSDPHPSVCRFLLSSSLSLFSLVSLRRVRSTPPSSFSPRARAPGAQPCPPPWPQPELDWIADKLAALILSLCIHRRVSLFNSLSFSLSLSHSPFSCAADAVDTVY